MNKSTKLTLLFILIFVVGVLGYVAYINRFLNKIPNDMVAFLS